MFRCDVSNTTKYISIIYGLWVIYSQMREGQDVTCLLLKSLGLN